MSRLDTASFLGLILFMLVCVAMSGGAMLLSVRRGEAVSAWVWAAMFLATSLIASWCFWRVV